jgi:hypothetical protein
MAHVELEHIFFAFSGSPGKEKIVFGPIGNGIHATLHLGMNSKIVDIHLTYEASPKRYETIFQIKYFTLLRLFIFIKSNVIPSLLKYYTNYVNVGKFRRHGCYIQPMTEESYASALIHTGNVKKFKVKKFLSESNLENLVFPLTELPPDCPSFALYGFRRGRGRLEGLIFKRFNRATDSSVIFVSKKTLNKMAKIMESECLSYLEKINKEAFISFSDLINLKLPG